MHDLLWLFPALLGGVVLSLVMVGGLWWTLRRLPSVRWPALFALASFWTRLALTVVALYLITAGDWQRGLAALLGFLIGRTVLLHWLGQSPATSGPKGA